MSEEQIQSQDQQIQPFEDADMVTKVIDFKALNKNMLDNFKIDHIDLQIDESEILNLQNLNLDNMLNLEINGNEEIKQNFQQIISAIIQSSQNTKQAVIQGLEISKQTEIQKQNQLKFQDFQEKLNKGILFQQTESKNTVQQIKADQDKHKISVNNQLNELREMIQKGQKNDFQENLILELKQKIEKQDLEIQDQSSKVEYLKQQVDKFLNLSLKSDKSGGDMNPLMIKIEGIQIQIDDINKKLKKTANQEYVDTINKQLKDEMLNEMNEFKQKLQKMQSEMNDLQSKLFQDDSYSKLYEIIQKKLFVTDFDKSIAMINLEIQNLKKNQPTNTTTQIVQNQNDNPQLIKEIQQKLNHMYFQQQEFTKETEDKLKNNYQEFQDYSKKINEQINDLYESKLDKSAYDEQKIKKQFQELNQSVGMIKQQLQSISVSLLNYELLFQKNQEFFNQIKEDQIQIKNKIENIPIFDQKKLEQDIQKSNQILQEQIIQNYNQIKIKSNLCDVKQIEQDILSKLEAYFDQYSKKSADKIETKKNLNLLEKKINDLMKQGMMPNQQEEPLLGMQKQNWQCLSCNQEMDKFQGKLNNFKNWAIYPPKETTPNHLGRFGMSHHNMMRNRKLGYQNQIDYMSQMQTLETDTNGLAFPSERNLNTLEKIVQKKKN